MNVAEAILHVAISEVASRPPPIETIYRPWGVSFEDIAMAGFCDTVAGFYSLNPGDVMALASVSSEYTDPTSPATVADLNGLAALIAVALGEDDASPAVFNLTVH